MFKVGRHEFATFIYLNKKSRTFYFKKKKKQKTEQERAKRCRFVWKKMKNLPSRTRDCVQGKKAEQIRKAKNQNQKRKKKEKK